MFPRKRVGPCSGLVPILAAPEGLMWRSSLRLVPSCHLWWGFSCWRCQTPCPPQCPPFKLPTSHCGLIKAGSLEHVFFRSWDCLQLRSPVHWARTARLDLKRLVSGWHGCSRGSMAGIRTLPLPQTEYVFFLCLALFLLFISLIFKGEWTMWDQSISSVVSNYSSLVQS